MARFAYEAIDPRGKESRGWFEVAGQPEALSRLHDMGLHPLRVIELARAKPPDAAPSTSPAKSDPQRWRRANSRGPRVSAGALLMFTRQLATLVGAGMPLLRGLRLLEEQEVQPGLRQVIRGVGAAIEGGSTFSEGLSQYPRVFNRLYVSLVQAGEAGGMQDVVLARLADFMEKSQRIKAKVIAAMYYPVAVIFIATAILAGLMIYVVPSFESVFKDMLGGRSLPFLTETVLGMSRWLAGHSLWVLGGFGAAFGLFKFCSSRAWGRRWLDRWRLRLPLIGPVIRKIAVARLARTLGTLLQSGVPILHALAIARDTAGNTLVSAAVDSVTASVKQGGTVAAPLAASRVFPVLMIGLVDVGEQTGALPEMLGKVADTYDTEVDNSIGALTSLLEPVLIVFLSVAVGGIVIALYLPLIDLIGVMSNMDRGDGGVGEF